MGKNHLFYPYCNSLLVYLFIYLFIFCAVHKQPLFIFYTCLLSHLMKQKKKSAIACVVYIYRYFIYEKRHWGRKGLFFFFLSFPFPFLVAIFIFFSLLILFVNCVERK